MKAKNLIAPLISSAFLITVSAQELHVTGVFSPIKAGSIPKPQATSDDAKLEFKTDGRWTYKIRSDKKLLGSSLIGFEQTPNEYRSENLRLKLPAHLDKPLKVSLYAVQIQDSNSRVREIYATDIAGGEMRSDELFRIYQEAAYLSLRRLQDIKQQPRPFYVYDVQLFYKYLEVARELGRKEFLSPSEGVLEIRKYFREQLNQESGKNAIRKALGGESGLVKVRQITKEIDFIDADHLLIVWNSLVSTPPDFSEKSCKNYEAFVSTIDDYDKRLVDRWNNDVKYRLQPLGLEAVRNCFKNNLQSPDNPEELARSAKNIGKITQKIIARPSGNREVGNLARSIDKIIAPMK